MVEECVNGVLATVDQIDDFRDTGFSTSSSDTRHRQRRLLGWLQHERVTARNGIWQKPERNHPGEVERRDDGDDPDRLTDHQLVDPGGDVLEVEPIISDGMPLATSTFSIPRFSSPSASARVLPQPS